MSDDGDTADPSHPAAAVAEREHASGIEDAVVGEPQTERADAGRWSASPPNRWATATFVTMVVVAFPVLLYLGRQRWFFLDEWDFLTDRSAGNLSDLFRPHDEHWSTIPILVYRGLYNLFGLHTYVPYQAVVVALHLGVVTLLWVIMRRLGVNPWLATLLAAILAFFGYGHENIIWAFQMGFVGSIAFGLGQLILVDHGGDLDRRDAIALVLGLAALMWSGVGVVMVATVGLACWMRRGWRPALTQVGPLTAIYLLWWAIEQPSNTQNPSHTAVISILGKIASFVVVAMAQTFSALGRWPVVAIAIAAVMLGGLGRAWVGLDWAGFRHRAAVPLAMLVGAVLFLLTSGAGRWFYGSAVARSSRYIYIVAVFLLPALGVAADALIRWWRWSALAIVPLLVVAVPSNVHNFAPTPPLTAALYRGQRSLVVSLANSPLAARVPRNVEPDSFLSFMMSAGWLVDAKRAGALPKAPPTDLYTASQFPVRFGVSQGVGTPPSATCTRRSGVWDLEPQKGQVFSITGGPFAVSSVNAKGRASAPFTFTPDPFFGTDPFLAHTFTIELPDLHLRIGSRAPLRVCT